MGLLSTIGGQIGIHGVPDNADGFVDTRSNWTWGCVSLKNADVDEIYSVASHNTVVEILP
ncbi:MAG: L,D-transpeptidase [Cyanobacteria bacterium J06634_6]